MDAAKILETLMLICFGAAWPLAIAKSWKARTAKGKSLCFLLVVLVGYVAGIGKVILTEGTGSFLMFPYTLNFIMVSIEVLLFFRNNTLDRNRDAARTPASN